jgi:hypothetical protein
MLIIIIDNLIYKVNKAKAQAVILAFALFFALILLFVKTVKKIPQKATLKVANICGHKKHEYLEYYLYFIINIIWLTL